MEKPILFEDISKYIHSLSEFFSKFNELKGYRFINGEICIFLSFKNEFDKRKILFIEGSNGNNDFKNKRYRNFTGIYETDE